MNRRVGGEESGNEGFVFWGGEDSNGEGGVGSYEVVIRRHLEGLPLDTFDSVSFQSFSLQIITIFVHWLFF